MKSKPYVSTIIYFYATAVEGFKNAIGHGLKPEDCFRHYSLHAYLALFNAWLNV